MVSTLFSRFCLSLDPPDVTQPKLVLLGRLTKSLGEKLMMQMFVAVSLLGHLPEDARKIGRGCPGRPHPALMGKAFPATCQGMESGRPPSRLLLAVSRPAPPAYGFSACLGI